MYWLPGTILPVQSNRIQAMIMAIVKDIIFAFFFEVARRKSWTKIPLLVHLRQAGTGMPISSEHCKSEELKASQKLRCYPAAASNPAQELQAQTEERLQSAISCNAHALGHDCSPSSQAV